MRSWTSLRPSHALLALSLVTGGCTRSEVPLVLDAGTDAPADVVTDADASPPPATEASKIDLLFVVDNSRNVEVPQDLFAESLPYLFDRLTRPACVNGLGNVVAQTESPDEPCPVGLRDIAPVTDLHVGVLSTSLGGHGADVCSPKSPSFDPIMDDKGRLVARDENGANVATYDGKGFLAWDPSQSLDPPGDADLPTFLARLDKMVRGVGLGGCGFESQLESMYRFLVDPEPYAEISVVDGQAQPTGIDEVVLQQRADFLRPDSAVVVILVTDENDCSLREGGQYYLAAQASTAPGNAYHLPRARSECEADPQDPCCVSCGQKAPASCGPNESDPSCALGPHDVLTDPINLRCFDQKRRFGIDFLYPVDRYVRALRETTIPDRAGELVPSPLVTDARSSELVFFAGIVGVPWQDIALDPKALVKGYRPASQIDWSLVVGDPSTATPPADPLMIESIAPREGVHPITGEEVQPPDAPALANAINGHERDIPLADDLQYACIYPRPIFKACNETTPDCECKVSDFDTNPLCQAPDGSYTNVQRFAKSLPSVRQLLVMRDLGAQAVPASICAPDVDDPAQPTFGYRPAIDAVLRALRPRLPKAPEETP
jgi:hypothetical protein